MPFFLLGLVACGGLFGLALVEEACDDATKKEEEKQRKVQRRVQQTVDEEAARLEALYAEQNEKLAAQLQETLKRLKS